MPTRTWDAVEDARSRIPRRSRQGPTSDGKRRRGARGRSHSARRADTYLHQPHLGGVSETFRHASPTDAGYMLLLSLLLLFATVRKKQHEEAHAARVTQSRCLSIRSPRSHQGPELHDPSLGPQSLHRGYERGQCHEMPTSCGQLGAHVGETAVWLTESKRKITEAAVCPFSSPIEPQSRRPQPTGAVSSGQTQL